LTQLLGTFKLRRQQKKLRPRKRRGAPEQEGRRSWET
jgi:hypothetical protein